VLPYREEKSELAHAANLSLAGTVNDVCRSMAEKIGFSDPEDDSLCFSLNECTDGVTSWIPTDLNYMS
jgi:hypothetical protein